MLLRTRRQPVGRPPFSSCPRAGTTVHRVLELECACAFVSPADGGDAKRAYMDKLAAGYNEAMRRIAADYRHKYDDFAVVVQPAFLHGSCGTMRWCRVRRARADRRRARGGAGNLSAFDVGVLSHLDWYDARPQRPYVKIAARLRLTIGAPTPTMLPGIARGTASTRPVRCPRDTVSLASCAALTLRCSVRAPADGDPPVEQHDHASRAEAGHVRPARTDQVPHERYAAVHGLGVGARSCRPAGASAMGDACEYARPCGPCAM